MNVSLSETSGRTWDEASSPEALRIAREYENSWRRSARRRPSLAEYMATLEDAAGSPGVRLALFRTDMLLRWEAGERVGAQWYLDRHPDLSEEAIVGLVYEEFCLLEENNGRPDPTDFKARYPSVAKALDRVLEIHGLVGSGTMSTTTLSPGGGNDSAEVAFPEVGQTIAGFHLVEELGRGAFARVFLAHERQLADRPVALKVTCKGSREPQTLARLQHTHIVPVYSHRVDPATGLNLLCMPYFGRITLAHILADPETSSLHYGADLAASLDRLAPNECLDPNRSEGRQALSCRTFARALAWWGARLAEALQHAHERGVLHRDVKPSNVLVTADGMPMLLDFNLASEPLVDGEPEGRSGTLGGTIDYMAPEHLEALAVGSPEGVDARSDMFSLGVVLYESLIGAKPFEPLRKGASVSQAFRRAADERRQGPPRLRISHPEIPPAFETVIRRCLEPAPEDRYQSGADLAADLQAVADARPLVFAREPLLSRLTSWARHRRSRLITATAIAATLCLLSAAGATVALQRRIDQIERFSNVREIFHKAEEAYKAQNYAQAKTLFGLAVQLCETPDWRKSITHGEGKGPSGFRALVSEVFSGSNWEQSLAELQNQAHNNESGAKSRAEWCGSADAFHEAADRLRFRLSGFGEDLAATSMEVDNALKVFSIVAPAPIEDWTRRPWLKDALDDARMARLRHDVSELMFLWVCVIDGMLARSSPPVPEYVDKALDLCDRALCFVERPGPWYALRARLERRWKPQSSPETSDAASSPDSVAPGDVNTETSALAAFQWGVFFFNEKKIDTALPWLERAVRLEAKNYWYQYYLAFAYDTRGGHAEEAMSHYNLATDLNPQSPWVRFGRARLDHRAFGNWKRAIEDLESALRELRGSPESRRIELELGIVHQSLGEDRKARTYFTSVIAKKKDDGFARAARLNLANSMAELGQIDQALDEYDQLLLLAPRDQATRRSRALLLLRAGRPREAESDLSTLAGFGDRCEERDRILSQRALARLMIGPASADGAVLDATEAQTLRMSSSHERLRQRALLAAGRVAELQLERPDQIDLLPQNGERLRIDLRSAVRSFDLLMRKGIAHPYPASLTQSVILAALGDRESAEAAATRALSASPDSPHALLIRARVRFFGSDVEGAIADVERGLQMHPNDSGLQELKGAILIRLGRPTEALKFLKLARTDTNVAIDILQARALMQTGDFVRALEFWSLATRKDPELAEAYLGRAECRIALKQWANAAVDLTTAATWANADARTELRILFQFTRCVAHQPWHARRWISLGLRTLKHVREQFSPAVRSS